MRTIAGPELAARLAAHDLDRSARALPPLERHARRSLARELRRWCEAGPLGALSDPQPRERSAHRCD